MPKPTIKQNLSAGPKWLYVALLAVLTFTGFGQMPIFNRYYITSIPGFGWTGDFFNTLNVHYLAAGVFLGLVVWYLVTRAAAGTLWPPKDGPSWVRTGLLALVVLSGFVLLARDMTGVHPGKNLIVAATLAHVFGTMIFVILAATYFRMKRFKKE
jgi:hypothetical protein